MQSPALVGSSPGNLMAKAMIAKAQIVPGGSNKPASGGKSKKLEDKKDMNRTIKFFRKWVRSVEIVGPDGEIKQCHFQMPFYFKYIT